MINADYIVEFKAQQHKVSEASNTFSLPVETTVVGSPSRNAVVSFIRDDGGPAINNLIVNTTGRLDVEVQIPNNMIRTGDQMFNVTLVTSDVLVTIGLKNTTLIYVSEDERKFIYVVIFKY